MKKNYSIILSAILLAATSVSAQIPRTIAYQGKLLEPDGSVMPDGTHQITLSLFDDPNSGSALFSEQQQISTKQGLFDLRIGSGTLIPDSVSFSKKYFLDVSIDNSLHLPRTSMNAVPYALNVRRTYSLRSDAIIPSDLYSKLFRFGGAASGDLSGSYPDPVVRSIRGFPVSAAQPKVGDVLQFDGKSWAPVSAPQATGFSVASGPDFANVYIFYSPVVISNDSVDGSFNPGKAFSKINGYVVPSSGIYYFSSDMNIDENYNLLSAEITVNNTVIFTQDLSVYKGQTEKTFPFEMHTGALQLNKGDIVQVFLLATRATNNAYPFLESVRFSGYKIN